MIQAKEVSIDPSAKIIARISCEGIVGLKEEDRLRNMLYNFYTRKSREFSRVAIEVIGMVILFRTIPNCKRSPNEEDIAQILVALNLMKLMKEKAPKPEPRKRLAVNRQSLTVNQ